jgi:hypothetical protein
MTSSVAECSCCCCWCVPTHQEIVVWVDDGQSLPLACVCVRRITDRATGPRFQQNLILNSFNTVHWNDRFQEPYLCSKIVHSPKESFFANWRLRKMATESQAIVWFCLGLSKTGHSNERFSEPALSRKNHSFPRRTVHKKERFLESFFEKFNI